MKVKVLSIQFPDSVDLSQFPEGEVVTVTKDANSATGSVLVQSTIHVPEPEVLPHIHPATTDIGPPA